MKPGGSETVNLLDASQLGFRIIELIQETARTQERIKQLIDSQEKFLESQAKVLEKLEVMQKNADNLDYRIREENKTSAELQAQLQELTTNLNLEISHLKESNERRRRLLVVMTIVIILGMILATVLGIESLPYLFALIPRLL